MSNRIITINFLLILCFSYTNFLKAQTLSFSQKKEWRSELKKMEKSDQQFRSLFKDHPELNNDSLWRLQTISDSINKAKFKEFTLKYGYPTWERVKFGATIAIILHFTFESDFNELSTLFKSELAKGNMPPKEYAWWYDRCQKNMGLPIYFGQYTNEKFCGEQLKIFNIRRKEIGLEALEHNTNCE